MPKARTTFSLADRELLRAALSWKLGMPLDGKAACLRAAEVLRRAGRYAPAGTTLYHLFVATNTGRKPYSETLHVLSRYLGFSDWHAFKRSAGTVRPHPGLSEEVEDILPDLLAICIRRKCFAVLDELFDGWTSGADNKDLRPIGSAIHRALYRDSSLEQPFFARYAAHPTVRASLSQLRSYPDLHPEGMHCSIQQFKQASEARSTESGSGWRGTVAPVDTNLSKPSGTRALHGNVSRGRLLPHELHVDHLLPATRYLAYAVWCDVLQRQRRGQSRKGSLLIEWVASCLREERSALERNFLFHALVDGFVSLCLLDKVREDLIRLFPDIDAEVFTDPDRLKAILASKDLGGLLDPGQTR